MHSLLPDVNRATAKGAKVVSPAAVKADGQVTVGKAEYNVILSLSRIPCLFIHEQVQVSDIHMQLEKIAIRRATLASHTQVCSGYASYHQGPGTVKSGKGGESMGASPSWVPECGVPIMVSWRRSCQLVVLRAEAVKTLLTASITRSRGRENHRTSR